MQAIKSIHYSSLFVILLFLLSACGGGSNQDTPDPTPTPNSSFTLVLGTNRLELTPGSSGSVPVTLQKSEGFANTVILAVAGAPEGLTSTFSSNPTEDSSELNINATEDVTSGTYTLFVQGLSGELRQSQALEVVVLSPAVKTITVTGKVVDDIGQPLAKARVRIGSTIAITDTQGAFRIEGVKAPYDLIIAVPQIGIQSEHAHIFQGLTRPDPTLPLLTTTPQSLGIASIFGNLSGGRGFPNPASQITRVGFASVEGLRERFLSEGDGPDFSVNRVRFQGERRLGTLYALQYLEDVSVRGRIAEYTGYAEKSLELVDEAEFNDQDLSLKPVTTGFLSANITAPAQFPLDDVTVGVELGTAEFLPIRDISPDSNTLVYAVPEIGKGLSLHVNTNRVEGRESELHRAGLLPNETVDLTLPIPPKLIEPADDMEGVDAETRIAWEGLEGGISIVEFRFSSQVSSRFLVYTRATETRFPDLGPEGLNPSSNTFVSWHVQGFGPYASLDEFTAPEATCGIRCNGSGKSYVAGTSETLNFRLR